MQNNVGYYYRSHHNRQRNPQTLRFIIGLTAVGSGIQYSLNLCRPINRGWVFDWSLREMEIP